MYTKINRDEQKRAIMGAMVGMMQNLVKLSPHPDCPNYRGALFTALPGWCHAPGDHDGMMGTIALEGMLGMAFSQVSGAVATQPAQDTPDLSSIASSALNAYEIYKSESEGERLKAAAHGRGSLARLSGVSIANSFNMRSSLSPAMQNFLEDMPERLRIEGQLSAYLTKLKALDIPIYEPSVRFAA